MPAAERPSRERIGPYRIVARVGVGGMGEVFKAWDPRLERDVAIKILHPQAADADQQRRLLAEGRAASALNHPNILRVYDADVDGDSYYLVSEWLEGRSLRDELSRGALTVKRVLELSVQIADGLAAAHAMGIVHRDIKPENVMLARDGTARIVDFGLARLDPSAATTQGHTASTVTMEGGLSGTPAYMSPEQARGQAGDFRTDQFSFGALLYEMATGKHAFRRDTMADTLAAVLHDEPKSIAAVNPRVPIALIWIIEQCLAKDAGERYAATEDLARELRRVRDRLRETAADAPAAETPRRLRSLLPIVAATAIIAATMGVAGVTWAPAAPELRFRPFASAAAYEGTPAWSHDGQSLAWVADVDGVLQVFVRRVTAATATQVTRGSFDAEEPFWAPNGREVYFISAAADGVGLWNVSTAGGRPTLVLENVTHAAIDAGNTTLAVLRNKTPIQQELWWAAADGSDLRRETRGTFGEAEFPLAGQLRFSPDGRQLLVWLYRARTDNRAATGDFYLLNRDPAGEARTTLTAVPSTGQLPPFTWLPDNRRVIVALSDPISGARHLWLADTQSTAMTKLTSTHTNETSPSLSPDGRTIAYASEEVDFDIVAITEDGRVRDNALATARNEMDPAWSPDGDQYAFVTDRSGEMEIWVRSRDGQWERPLVTRAEFGGTRNETLGSLTFSPDGRTLAFHRRGPNMATLWLVPVAGGTPVQLLEDVVTNGFQDAPSWSPDGEWVSFTRSNGPQFSLAKVRVGTKEVVTLAESVQLFARPIWSPDGARIAVEARDGLAILSAQDGAPEAVVAESLLAFTWSLDSRRIIGLQEGERLGHFALVEIDARTRQLTVLNPDLGSIPVANQPIRGFSLVQGHGILTSLARARSDIWLLEGFEPPVHPLQRWLRRR